MLDQINQLRDEILKELSSAGDLKVLEDLRVRFLGKKGNITALAKSMGSVAPEERKTMGQAINGLKTEIEAEIASKKGHLSELEFQKRLATEKLDPSLPPRQPFKGSIHPVSQVTDELIAIFAEMGFGVAEGPDIDDDFHNFTALNFPEGHPAREMHDTFFLDHRDDGGEPYLLRTHTSTVQIRHMQNNKPPHRIVAPGRVYRCDSDATHTPCFHQIEALMIDRRTHFGHLKGCLIEFLHAFFERDDIPVRFRPSFFPFTEPSAEVDIGCKRSKDELIVGEGDDWLEVLGCGMVHPNVLKAVNLDPNEWQGFAFGAGIDRLAMLKYGIPDLRTFFDADISWSGHYGFSPYFAPTIFSGLSR